MGPLLVLMLCPIWLPLLGMLIGTVSQLFSGGSRPEPARAPRKVRAEPAEARGEV
ncbi:hypothetical protein [Amycolatopsis orientalis]|uniref:hypothetical protein n=1 Tax=Amycolatopsis orientalis TaxID=31958 RepID=UPI001319BF84|nr:hypothetical protein [Amycolatopsis orientalis]